MTRKLLWRLFASYLWITVLALAVATFYGATQLKSLHERNLRNDLAVRASLIRSHIGGFLSSGDHAAIDQYCKEQGKEVKTRITVILPDGKVVGDSEENPARMDNHRLRPEIDTAFSGGQGFIKRYSDTLHCELMYLAEPLYDTKKNIVAVVRTSIKITKVEESLAAMRDKIIFSGVIAVLLVAIVSLFLSSRISRRLNVMRAGAENFSEGNFAHKIPASGVEELDDLAHSLNRMADQLAERIGTITRQQKEQDAVLSSMVEGVLAVDSKGRMININPAAAGMLGVERSVANQRLVHEVIRKPDVIKFVEQAVAEDEPLTDDIHIRESGGDDRFLRANGVALRDSADKKIGALIVLHDITRLQKLENVRRDFVANVSHEIRTPITSIKGFVETVLDGAIDNREDTERFLNIVLRQTDRLNAIVEDLLSLSRIEKQSESDEVDLAMGNIAPAVRNAAEVCSPKAADKGVDLRVECDEKLRAKINPSLLEQAVVNLVDNAIKYTESGRMVEVILEEKGGYAQIAVRDEGCGIEKRHLPRLFERFYRVDRARSRELGGTGLGLAIVKHIALAHRGRIEVDSTPGVGSIFTILIPLE